MPATRSFYEVLGIHATATPEDIKRAWRDRLKVVHPDKGGTARETIEVQAAYLVLSDPAERQKYDRDRQLRTDAPVNSSARGQPAAGNQSTTPAAAKADWTELVDSLLEQLERHQGFGLLDRMIDALREFRNDEAGFRRAEAAGFFEKADYSVFRERVAEDSARRGVPRCAGRKANGQQCLNFVRGDNTHCHLHGGSTKAQRGRPSVAAERRSYGGPTQHGPLWSPQLQHANESVDAPTFGWVRPVCWFFGTMIVINLVPVGFMLVTAVVSLAAYLFDRSRRRKKR